MGNLPFLNLVIFVSKRLKLKRQGLLKEHPVKSLNHLNFSTLGSSLDPLDLCSYPEANPPKRIKENIPKHY
jgi:hypothetical protein